MEDEWALSIGHLIGCAGRPDSATDPGEAARITPSMADPRPRGYRLGMIRSDAASAASASPLDVGFDAAAWTRLGLEGEPIPRADARRLVDPEGGIDLWEALGVAGRVRERHFGRDVLVHQLHNVQNGACPEDCGYCGQSRDSTAPIQPYRLKPRAEIIAEAEQARANGAYRYCMVLSGRGPSDADIDHMIGCIREIRERLGLRTCLSAGLMSPDQTRRLAEAGLDRLNHNLNTSRERYPAICTTHTYDERVETLRHAKAAGLSLCSGLIVGMGEAFDDLVDVAFALRDLGAESIPVNFLVPIPGNPITEATIADRPLTPEIALRALALFRLVNPSAEVRIGAGREGHLRSMQALALRPANSLFVNGYLLTRGSEAWETIRLIVDAGYRLRLEGSEWPDEFRAMIDDLAAGGSAAFAIDASGETLRPDRLDPRKVALTLNSGPLA